MDRNTITAFVIIGLIIVLMPTYMKFVSPEQEVVADSTSTQLDVQPYQGEAPVEREAEHIPDYSLTNPSAPTEA